MPRILVVYGSVYGQTERIAQRIGQILADAGHTTTLHRGDRLPPGLTLHDFDGVVVAGSVHRGRHQPYLETFARRHAPGLNGLPTAFISVSGTAASANPEGRAAAEECVATFVRETGWRPGVTRTFGGALAYTRYNWLLRLAMRWISRRNGGPTDTSRDHDLTDWQAVERFAHELAAEVFAPAGTLAFGGMARSPDR